MKKIINFIKTHIFLTTFVLFLLICIVLIGIFIVKQIKEKDYIIKEQQKELENQEVKKDSPDILKFIVPNFVGLEFEEVNDTEDILEYISNNINYKVTFCGTNISQKLNLQEDTDKLTNELIKQFTTIELVNNSELPYNQIIEQNIPNGTEITYKLSDDDLLKPIITLKINVSVRGANIDSPEVDDTNVDYSNYHNNDLYNNATDNNKNSNSKANDSNSKTNKKMTNEEILNSPEYFTKYKLKIINKASTIKSKADSIYEDMHIKPVYDIGPSKFYYKNEIIGQVTSYNNDDLLEKKIVYSHDYVQEYGRTIDNGYLYIRKGENISDIAIDFNIEYEAKVKTDEYYNDFGYTFRPKFQINGNIITLVLDTSCITGPFYG